MKPRQESAIVCFETITCVEHKLTSKSGSGGLNDSGSVRHDWVLPVITHGIEETSTACIRGSSLYCWPADVIHRTNRSTWYWLHLGLTHLLKTLKYLLIQGVTKGFLLAIRFRFLWTISKKISRINVFDFGFF